MRKLFFFAIFGTFIFSASAQITTWELNGNAPSKGAFLGTTNSTPLIFKTNGTEWMRLLSDKPFLGIGTDDPKAILHLHKGIVEQPSGVINFLKLTTPGLTNGFSRSFSIYSYDGSNDIYLKQDKMANLFIEGPAGGLAINPGGTVCIGGGEGNVHSEKLYVNGNAVIDGNILADTVKINKSIFMPENKLTFSGYNASSGKDGDGGDDDGIDPGHGGQQSAIPIIMGLQRVGTENRVGIGTSAPKYNLHVFGTGMFTKRLILRSIEAISDQYSELKLQIGETWTFFDMNYAKIMGSNCLFMDNVPPTRCTYGAASAMMMKNNGSIQLCTAPDGSGDLSWNYVTMLDNGNVGIGTEIPTKKLHVQGDAYISGRLDVGDGFNIESFIADTVKINKSIFLPEKALTFTYYDDNGVGHDEPDPFSDGMDGDSLRASGVKKFMTMKLTGPLGETPSIHVHGDTYTSGNLGIGTTFPSKKLHVVGDSYFNGNVGIGTSSPASGKKLHVQGDSYLSGNVGIGTNDPQSKLHVMGNVFVQDGTFSLAFGKADGQDLMGTSYIGFNATRKKDQIGNWTWELVGDGTHNGGSVIWTTVGGNIYFASIPSTGKNDQILTDEQIKNNAILHLTTDGVLKAKEVLVTLTGWPDYVFAEDYGLQSLDEVASYIEQNKHLPEMPSAAEVAENGVNLGEMNALLLKKVEELTLYILQQNGDIQELKEEVRLLKERGQQ